MRAGDGTTTLNPRSFLDPDVYPTQWVTITTVGATFSPRIGRINGGPNTTVWWEVDGVQTTTGPAPDFNFGSAATRTVRFGVTSHFSDALNIVETINMGYDGADGGQISSVYFHPHQQAIAITGLTQCTNLKYFMSSHPVEYDNSSVGKVLSGTLDLTGLAKLEQVECYYNQISNVVLNGCTSLVRLDMEHNSQSTLDLNPVAPNLRDIRSANQRTGALTLVPLTQPMAQLWHLCVRDQTITNFPTAAQLPVIVELLCWNTGRTSLTVRSSSLQLVQAYLNPSLASLDIVGQFPAGRGGRVQAFGCALTSLDLTGCEGVGYLDLQNNSLTQASVDAILTKFNSFNTSGGTINLLGNATPSAAGVSAKAALQARGWAVSTA